MIDAATDGCASHDVARAWAENAARTVEWIERHGGDIMTDPAEPLRARVFSPVKPTRPGLRYRGLGVEQFLTRLIAAFAKRRGVLEQPARAVGLTSGTSARWQLRLSAKSGPENVEATSVILADGGFQGNASMLRKYVGTDKVKLRAVGTATGDGLRMGLAAGGVAINMKSFYGHLLAREALGNDELWPYPLLDGLAALGVVVGASGMRIVDEGHSGVTTTNHIAWCADPLGQWVVIDDAAWNGHGRLGVTPPNPHLLEHGATVLTAPTLASLARLAHIDPEGLQASVDDVRTGPRSAKPPRTGAVSLDTPPFHAIPLVAGVTFTFGGLRVDGHARVLDRAGAPIAGLYAAGGTMGGLHGGPRAGYGGGLLEAAVFGLLAGEHVGQGGS
jgi:fumarate reductase flavoprotein subunit